MQIYRTGPEDILVTVSAMKDTHIADVSMTVYHTIIYTLLITQCTIYSYYIVQVT